MEKTFTIFSFIAVMTFANISMATTWTATDNPNFSFRNGKSYNDALVLNGFTPGIDTITSASLLLDFDKTGIVTEITFDGIKDSSWHLVVDGIGGALTYQVPDKLLADGKLDLDFTGYGFNFGSFKGLTLDSVTLLRKDAIPPLLQYLNPAPWFC
jgi:hypothetical protein